MARPSIYSLDLIDRICERLAGGESLVAICEDDEMPARSTVFKWLDENKEFSDRYVRAREAQADLLAEEIIKISDDGLNDTYEIEPGVRGVNHDVIARSRLRVDARKWMASKLAPKKYGDKVTNEHVGANGGDIVTRIVLTSLE